MGRAKGRRVSAQSPLGASLVGSPRQERALAAAAAGQREHFPIAQRQPSPLGGRATRSVARLTLSHSLLAH